MSVRLRQLVLAARDLEPAVAALQGLLGAPAPYRDPGVGVFGLRNAVLTSGSSFVEVISPERAGTAAGRWLDRHAGDGGYMVMVEVPDVDPVRQRLPGLGVRVVWEKELPDVVDVHLHPTDVGGCLLAVDAVSPPGSWRWAGPSWTGRVPVAPGGLRALELAVPDPQGVASRWCAVLGLPRASGPDLVLDGESRIRFTAQDDPTRQGVVGATLALPTATPRRAVVAGVELNLVPLEEDEQS